MRLRLGALQTRVSSFARQRQVVDEGHKQRYTPIVACGALGYLAQRLRGVGCHLGPAEAFLGHQAPTYGVLEQVQYRGVIDSHGGGSGRLSGAPGRPLAKPRDVRLEDAGWQSVGVLYEGVDTTHRQEL